MRPFCSDCKKLSNVPSSTPSPMARASPTALASSPINEAAVATAAAESKFESMAAWSSSLRKGDRRRRSWLVMLRMPLSGRNEGRKVVMGRPSRRGWMRIWGMLRGRARGLFRRRDVSSPKSSWGRRTGGRGGGGSREVGGASAVGVASLALRPSLALGLGGAGGAGVWVAEESGDTSGGLRRRCSSVGRAVSEERARCRRERLRERPVAAAGGDVADGEGEGEGEDEDAAGSMWPWEREAWRLASGLRRCDDGRGLSSPPSRASEGCDAGGAGGRSGRKNSLLPVGLELAWPMARAEVVWEAAAGGGRRSEAVDR